MKLHKKSIYFTIYKYCKMKLHKKSIYDQNRRSDVDKVFNKITEMMESKYWFLAETRPKIIEEALVLPENRYFNQTVTDKNHYETNQVYGMAGWGHYKQLHPNLLSALQNPYNEIGR